MGCGILIVYLSTVREEVCLLSGDNRGLWHLDCLPQLVITMGFGSKDLTMSTGKDLTAIKLFADSRTAID